MSAPVPVIDDRAQKKRFPGAALHVLGTVVVILAAGADWYVNSHPESAGIGIIALLVNLHRTGATAWVGRLLGQGENPK